MSLRKRIVSSRPFQRTVGFLIAEWLRFVWRTTKFVYEPAAMYSHGETLTPVIIAMWHGQHFLSPFLRREQPAKALISRHRDGEINSIAAEHLGVEVIRGSGAHNGEFQQKGGVEGFREMLDALAQGYNVALTADVPKKSRAAGLGIVKLASVSGRPIYITAIATRNRFILNNWDRSAVNLPFGRGAVVGIGPVWIAQDADEAALETARRQIEHDLNAVTARAYEIVDGARKDGGRA